MDRVCSIIPYPGIFFSVLLQIGIFHLSILIDVNIYDFIKLSEDELLMATSETTIETIKVSHLQNMYGHDMHKCNCRIYHPIV